MGHQGRIDSTLPLTPFDRVTALSFRIFKGPARAAAKGSPRLKVDLLKSDMTVTPEGLVSLAFFLTTVSIAPTALVVGVLLALGIALGLVFLAVPVLTFSVTMYYPHISQSSRASRLDDELPFVVGFMSILAGGRAVSRGGPEDDIEHVHLPRCLE
ncbi:MAG: hypothetical protein HY296_02695 [Thaumarchaeota archaeon]|nr:hypothetical protein [Nitrososphaerota archaeon]